MAPLMYALRLVLNRTVSLRTMQGFLRWVVYVLKLVTMMGRISVPRLVSVRGLSKIMFVRWSWLSRLLWKALVLKCLASCTCSALLRRTSCPVVVLELQIVTFPRVKRWYIASPLSLTLFAILTPTTALSWDNLAWE